MPSAQDALERGADGVHRRGKSARELDEQVDERVEEQVE